MLVEATAEFWNPTGLVAAEHIFELDDGFNDRTILTDVQPAIAGREQYTNSSMFLPTDNCRTVVQANNAPQ